MTDTLPDTAVLDTALQMVDVWNRLSADKQALLLKRFGTQETPWPPWSPPSYSPPFKPDVFLI